MDSLGKVVSSDSLAPIITQLMLNPGQQSPISLKHVNNSIINKYKDSIDNSHSVWMFRLASVYAASQDEPNTFKDLANTSL